ncbi:helix-turn-helix domain-containing protein [Streptomyces sp. NPDC046805]|uniref:helix-turn-helix domain-containing protein n=1 Tax=Streptomyces sp. NPDC046805 TaxID=3155134 RepID=UPI00340209C8
MPRSAGDTPSPPAELLIAARFTESVDYAVTRTVGAANWLLMWTTHGRGAVRGTDGWTAVHPGDLVLFPAGCAHAYRTDPDAGSWGGWWVHYQPRAAWPAWLRDRARPDRLFLVAGVPAEVRGRVDDAFRRLHADARWSGGESPPDPVAAMPEPTGIAVAAAGAGRELALGAIEEVLLLVTASTAARDRAAAEPVDTRIRQAQAVIAADPAAPHTVRSLAAHVALSPSRFAHLFTEHTGRTPMQAVRAARLSHAQRLLDATDLEVRQIALASGFASPFHFSRAFRRQYGVPPRAYRARPKRG